MGYICRSRLINLPLKKSDVLREKKPVPELFPRLRLLCVLLRSLCISSLSQGLCVVGSLSSPEALLGLGQVELALPDLEHLLSVLRALLDDVSLRLLLWLLPTERQTLRPGC